MALLNFDVPAKKNMGGGFDGGADGGYVPQMGKEDSARWKAKKFNIGKPNARIELRKTFGVNNGKGWTQVTIFVAKDGWDYAQKHEYIDTKNVKDNYFNTSTKGLQVRMSMNGPLLMTFKEFSEINEIVNEALEYIK